MQSPSTASPSAKLSRSFQDAADPLQTPAVFALKWHEKPAPAYRGVHPGDPYERFVSSKWGCHSWAIFPPRRWRYFALIRSARRCSTITRIPLRCSRRVTIKFLAFKAGAASSPFVANAMRWIKCCVANVVSRLDYSRRIILNVNWWFHVSITSLIRQLWNKSRGVERKKSNLFGFFSNYKDIYTFKLCIC